LLDCINAVVVNLLQFEVPVVPEKLSGLGGRSFRFSGKCRLSESWAMPPHDDDSLSQYSTVLG